MSKAVDSITFATAEELDRDLEAIFKNVASELLNEAEVEELGGPKALAKAFEGKHSGSLREIHDYAVNGKAGCRDRDDVIDLMGIVRTISALCKQFGGKLADSNFKALANVEALYIARAKLDGEESMGIGTAPLGVRDVAVLAGISEAAVRNAISRKELVTYREANATLIKNSAALEWLKKRRAFRPTVFTGAGQMLYLEDIDSPESLASYLAYKRKQVRGCRSAEDLIAEFPDSGLSLAELKSLEGGVLITPITKYEKLARLYKEEGAQFMEMMLKVFHPEQYKEIRASSSIVDHTCFEHYQRDKKVEDRFGAPDYRFWSLYQQAEELTDKNAVVRALHLVMVASGKDLDYTRSVLNSYTLALYKKNGSGVYTADAHKNARSYSEPGVYGFIYDSKTQFKATRAQRNTQLNATNEALETAWATHLLASEGVSRAEVMTRFDELRRRWC